MIISRRGRYFILGIGSKDPINWSLQTKQIVYLVPIKMRNIPRRQSGMGNNLTSFYLNVRRTGQGDIFRFCTYSTEREGQQWRDGCVITFKGYIDIIDALSEVLSHFTQHKTDSKTMAMIGRGRHKSWGQLQLLREHITRRIWMNYL